MTAQPETLTILFTDLVNSTELLQRVGEETAQRIFEAHHRLLREAVAAHGGAETQSTGDGLMVAFGSATTALRCAIAMQQAARRPAAGARLQIRVGLQTGETLRHEGAEYFGSTVVIASRLCALAQAGEILCPEIVRALVPDASAFQFRDRGELMLKGIARPIRTWSIKYSHDPLAMLTHTPFVGREAESAVLRAKLGGARAGKGAVVMLVGEPGIGKTRTIEEFAAHARSQGARVLGGRCYDGEWAPPFSPFVEALRDYARETPAAELTAALVADAGVLARIVPQVREVLPDIPEPPALQAEGERYRLLDAVADVFGRIAAAKPLVLVLDDLHWADKGTIAMVRHVARSAAAKPVLILGAYRDVELDRQHPLAAALADLRRETSFERIPLKGLDKGEVGELLDVIAEQDVPRPLVDAIAAETNGNPFFIKEVLLHVVEERKIVREDGRWTSSLSLAEMGIPEGVREVIGRRLSRLSDAARAMLTVASEFADGFSFDEIAALMGNVRLNPGDAPPADEKALLDAFDEALDAQLIVDVSRGTYDFPHALVRHTLYEALSEPRRVRLHAQVAEGLEARAGTGADAIAGRLAGRFAEAAVLSTAYAEKALRYSRIAAEQAEAQFAFDDAARHYGRCIEMIQLIADAQPADEAALLRSLGRCLRNSGEYRAAWRTLLRAVQCFEDAGDAAGLAQTALEALDMDVPPDRFRPLVIKALDAIGGGDPHLRAQLLTAWLRAPLAPTLITSEEVKRYRAELDAPAQTSGFDDVQAHLLFIDARDASAHGKLAKADALLRRAFDEYERLGMTRDAAHVLYNRSTRPVQTGDLAAAQAVAEANLEWVQQRHMRYQEVHIAASLAYCCSAVTSIPSIDSRSNAQRT